MSALGKKLFRTIWKSKGSFLAVVAVVMVGISVYISMTTAFYNLSKSRDMFYQDNDFADYFFHVVKAPEEILKQIEAVPGVIKATGRIQKDLSVLKEKDERALVRLISYPLPMEKEINRLHLLRGRLFDKSARNGDIEILVDPQHASANNLAQGGYIKVVAEGKLVSLKVVGTATSPEFIYPMKDASSLMPEPDKFGIIMISHKQAQQLLNISGQINMVAVKLLPGTNVEITERRIKEILEPYGNLVSYDRKDQLSHAVLKSELDGLEATSKSLPVIFLLVAAAIQFIMISRMVKNQRLQIGVMKALGYNNWQIILHYNSFAISIALLGASLGSLLGLVFAGLISQTYAMFFNLPEAIGGVNYKAIINGFALSIGVALTAGLIATRKIIAINPAEAMRTEPPKKGGSSFLERLPWLWQKLSSQWKMSLRTIGRNKVRFVITVFGVLFAVALLINSLFFNDSLDYLLKKHFSEEQSYDYLIRFAQPIKEQELLNIKRLDGVLLEEPILEIPVKISYDGLSEDDLLVGLSKDTTLRTLYTLTETKVNIPEDGVIINKRTADKLGVKIGEKIEIETQMGYGPKYKGTLRVVGMHQQVIGGGNYLNIEQANQIIREMQIVNGVMLKVDLAYAKDLEKELNKMTAVSSVLSKQKEMESFTTNLDSLIYFTAVMVGFAVLLGFTIVYNASVINFAERYRELASLRVIGFTQKEVSNLLIKEILLQSFIGIILGLPAGYFMAEQYIKAVNSDLYSFPIIIYPKTYIYAALGGLLFTIMAHLVATRGIKDIDLASALKNRD